jgi:hypothetical protein
MQITTLSKQIELKFVDSGDVACYSEMLKCQMSKISGGQGEANQYIEF